MLSHTIDPETARLVMGPTAHAELAVGVVTFDVPDSSPWHLIRHKWGEPSFYVLQTDPSHGLAPTPAAVRATKRGAPTLLQPCTEWPYGYSTREAPFCQTLEAAAGSHIELVVRVGPTGNAPSGELVVTPSWITKDRIVGVAIDQLLRPYFVAAAWLGGMLFVLGVLLAKRRHS